MEEGMKWLYWHTYIILLASRGIFDLHLGDRVVYLGREWTLTQGVHSPMWTLRQDGERVDVHESEFRKVRSLSNYWHSFTSMRRFYIGYWLDIWMRNGIEPWMRGCNIWPDRGND